MAKKKERNIILLNLHKNYSAKLVWEKYKENLILKK